MTRRSSALRDVARDAVVVDLYERHFWHLAGAARLLVDDANESEDVVQEAFSKLYSSLRRIEDPARTLSYLRSIVLNLARDRLRRRQRARRALTRLTTSQLSTGSVTGPTQRLSEVDRRHVVDAIRSLPRRQLE